MKPKRHQNKGLRKHCDCPRRAWAKCQHAWHFNFQPRGGQGYRFSLDKHFNRHIDSKTEAEDLAADLRKQIRAGTFGQPMPLQAMTMQQLADVYYERHVQVKCAANQAAHRYQLDAICKTTVRRPTEGSAPLGEWRVSDIVTDTIERFREVRAAGGSGPVAINRYLETLRSVFNFAVRVGYVAASPFKRGTETVVKFEDEAPRTRRLRDGEEKRLLAACGLHLRACVEAALETGMRLGEILSLQWVQVEGMRVDENDNTQVSWAPRAELFLPKSKTKTKRDRRIPISTRLRSILELRRLDPAGKPLASDKFVFGNAVGEQVQSPRRAWYTAVLKAHGHEPTYAKGANLDADSRAALRTIDLHFHDLRREAGSRWMDAGVPLATIQRWLGHSNVSQTSVYLAGSSSSEHDHMRRFEERRDACNGLATDAGSQGYGTPPAATRLDEKASKTAEGYEPTIM
ncbi:MAG: site-specific integrase [Acidobacteriota bacterium]|nr:site-specific integrase [Acidobacteriota bacterium]